METRELIIIYLILLINLYKIIDLRKLTNMLDTQISVVAQHENYINIHTCLVTSRSQLTYKTQNPIKTPTFFSSLSLKYRLSTLSLHFILLPSRSLELNNGSIVKKSYLQHSWTRLFVLFGLGGIRKEPLRRHQEPRRHYPDGSRRKSGNLITCTNQ